MFTSPLPTERFITVCHIVDDDQMFYCVNIPLNATNIAGEHYEYIHISGTQPLTTVEQYSTP